MPSVKKSVYLGAVAALVAGTNSYAETFDSAIKNATTSGQFRLGYINQEADIPGAVKTSAGAVGGQLKFETGNWNGVQFAIAPYFVEKVDALSGDEAAGELNGDYFDANNDSFAYLGEAYVNFGWSGGSVRYGRQQLDNPSINTDDIRMLPNTFNAVWFNMLIGGNLSIEAGKVSTWAGFDSGPSQEVFKPVGNDGVLAVGATYKMKDHHTFQLWHYDFDQAFSQNYAEAIYANGPFEAGMQYTNFSEDNASGIDGSAWGLSAAYDFGVLRLSAAVNEASNDPGKAVSNGLGGGAFFTSMDEITIAGINNASSYLLSLDYAATDALTLTAAFAHFEDGDKITDDLDELNLVIAYQVNKSMDVSYTHTDLENGANTADPDTNFTRQQLIVNYNF